jgi:hypothetical protein
MQGIVAIIWRKRKRNKAFKRYMHAMHSNAKDKANDS